jgi:hypothetical protein
MSSLLRAGDPRIMLPVFSTLNKLIAQEWLSMIPGSVPVPLPRLSLTEFVAVAGAGPSSL